MPLRPTDVASFRIRAAEVAVRGDKMLSRYFDDLATTLATAAIPYGHALAVRSTGALVMNRHSKPTAADRGCSWAGPRPVKRARARHQGTSRRGSEMSLAKNSSSRGTEP
jgi:hypothetical protein